MKMAWKTVLTTQCTFGRATANDATTNSFYQ